MENETLILARWLELLYDPEFFFRRTQAKTQCGHTVYNSKLEFISQLLSTFKELDEFHEDLDISEPICESCEQELVFEPLNQLMNRKRMGDIMRACILCKQCSVIFISQYFECCYYSTQMIASTISFNLFGNANSIKFFYKYTSIWLWHIHDTISILIQAMNLSSPRDQVRSPNVALSTIQEHLRFLKYKHWKTITFKTGLMFILIKVIRHIGPNGKHYDHSRSQKYYCLCCVLIAYWLPYYNRLKTKYRFTLRYKKMFSAYEKEIESLKDYSKKTDLTLFGLMGNTYCISMIGEYALTFRRIIISRRRCFREGCNVTNANNKNAKFMKCSNCYIAAYCSRHCAKIDWNYGCHKQCCDKIFAKLRNIKLPKNSQVLHNYRFSLP